jgi:hypothetical protein
MNVTHCLKNCLYIQKTDKIWFEVYIKYGPHQTNLGQNWIYNITYQVSLNTILCFSAGKHFFPLSVQKICSQQNIRNQTVLSENPQDIVRWSYAALICYSPVTVDFVLNDTTHWHLLHPHLIHEAQKWRWLIYHSFAVKFLTKYYKLKLCREMNVCPWVVTSTKNTTWH